MVKKQIAKVDQGDKVGRFFAFLQGINVGKRTVKSLQLIEAFSAVGLDNVQTFLASGNVAFETGRRDLDMLRGEIEKQLIKSLGFESKTFLRSLDEIVRIANANMFGLNAYQQKNFTVNVSLLDKPATAAMKKRLATLRSDYDDFACCDSEIWWLCRGPKISDSKLFQGNRLKKDDDGPSTMRNQRTLQRLAEKFGLPS